MRCVARYLVCCVSVVCAVAGGTLGAQTLPTAPQITVSTHLVQISVIVRDRKSTANAFRKDEFSVLDEGKPRRISVFEMESDGAQPKAGPTQAEGSSGGTFSNGEVDEPGNVTVILLDNLNTLTPSAAMNYEDSPVWQEGHALANAKQHLLEALKGLNPRDRIAVYGLNGNLRLLCDFTCDREELLAAVKGYDVSSKTQREAVEPGQYHLPGADERFSQAVDAGNAELAGRLNSDRTQATMMGLRAIAEHVARIPGRKNLLWLTANLPFSGQAVARILGPANIAAYPVDARGLLPAMVMLSGPAPPPAGIAAMEEMAADTGGHAFVNTNDISKAVREVIEEPGARYTIGFYVDQDSVDGKFHELKVQVRRVGVTLHAPKGYFAVKDAPAGAGGGRAKLMAAIQSPFDMTGVPLEVTAARVEQPRPHLLKLTGSVEIKDLPMPQAGDVRHGTLDVLVVEQDAAGNVLHQATNQIVLTLTAAQYEAYLRSGVAFLEYVQPQPGTTVVRVLVRDAGTMQMGSVVIPLKGVR